MSSKKESSVCADLGTYETVDFEDVGLNSPVPIKKAERYLMPTQYLVHIFSRIEGVILTLIESAVDDKERREATKSLLKRLIWAEAEKIRLLKLKKIK